MNQRHTPRSNKWRVCPRCNGDGRLSANLGAITAEEFAEAYDPEDLDNYDLECGVCSGVGKVHQRRVRSFDRWVARL